MADCYNFVADAKIKLKIETPTEAIDSYGGRTISWSTLATVWAALKPVSGREVFAQQAQQKRITHVATIRYLSSLANIANIRSYRVSYGTRLFDMNYVTNLDENLEFEGKRYQRLHLEENGAGING